MTAPVYRPLGWWASEDRWFNRDLVTRIVLLVVWLVAVPFGWLDRLVSGRVAA